MNLRGQKLNQKYSPRARGVACTPSELQNYEGSFRTPWASSEGFKMFPVEILGIWVFFAQYLGVADQKTQKFSEITQNAVKLQMMILNTINFPIVSFFG